MNVPEGDTRHGPIIAYHGEMRRTYNLPARMFRFESKGETKIVKGPMPDALDKLDAATKGARLVMRTGQASYVVVG